MSNIIETGTWSFGYDEAWISSAEAFPNRRHSR